MVVVEPVGPVDGSADESAAVAAIAAAAVIVIAVTAVVFVESMRHTMGEAVAVCYLLILAGVKWVLSQFAERAFALGYF